VCSSDLSALSVCYFAKNRDMDYDLIYLDKEGKKKRYVPLAFHETMDLVADLPHIGSETNGYSANALLMEEGNSLYAKSNIALCTANPTEEIIETLLMAKKNGRNAAMFYVIPDDAYDDEKAALLRPLKRLADAGVRYYVFSSVEMLARN
jgi:hypothetical protein